MIKNMQIPMFEDSYKPTKLRNWEVPKWYPDRPCQNVGHTNIISNDRGHLLPGVPRKPTNPWGNFIGTWHLPKKITREVANELTATSQDKIDSWKRHCHRGAGFELKSPKEDKEIPKAQQPLAEVKQPQVEDDLLSTPSDEELQPDKAALCPIHDYD